MDDPDFNPSYPDHDFRGYWAMHDANFDVLGIVDASGALVERYTYTPYGQRRVFFSPGANDPKDYAATLNSRRVTTSGGGGTPTVTQPYGLNPFGHQGLLHDEETGGIYNRRRYYLPRLGRFAQRDPIGYGGGSMSLYQYVRSNPVHRTDPWGLIDGEDMRPRPLPPNPNSPWDLGWGWLTGQGPADQGFGPGSPMVQDLKNHEGIAKARQDAIATLAQNCQSCNGSASGPISYSLAGLSGVGKYIRDYSVIGTGGMFGGNLAATYLGTYQGTWSASGSCCKGEGTVTFTVTNRSGAQSGTRFPVIGYQGRPSVQDIFGDIISGELPSGWVPGSILSDNPLGTGGPLSTKSQTFEWEEQITFKANSNCKD